MIAAARRRPGNTAVAGFLIGRPEVLMDCCSATDLGRIEVDGRSGELVAELHYGLLHGRSGKLSCGWA